MQGYDWLAGMGGYKSLRQLVHGWVVGIQRPPIPHINWESRPPNICTRLVSDTAAGIKGVAKK